MTQKKLSAIETAFESFYIIQKGNFLNRTYHHCSTNVGCGRERKYIVIAIDSKS